MYKKTFLKKLKQKLSSLDPFLVEEIIDSYDAIIEDKKIKGMKENDIIKEFNNLKNGYKNKSIPMYQLEKRLEKLHYNVDDFNPTSEKKNEDLDYIDRFLEKNKDYYATTVSKDYLKSVYEKLNQKSNEAIEKYSNDLDEYIEQNSPNLNQDIIDKTIETQNKINERLNNLIQAEKNKFYEQSYKDFQKNNPDF